MERLIIINYRSGEPGKFSTIIRDMLGMKKFADDITIARDPRFLEVNL